MSHSVMSNTSQSFPCIMYLNLSKTECDEVIAIARSALGPQQSISVDMFLEGAAVLAHGLPEPIRSAMHRFRLHEHEHAVCVLGPRFSDEALGVTPQRHRPPNEIERVRLPEAVHILFSTLLGEPFGWSSIQNGYIINDVMPVEEHREVVASSGWNTVFDLHTEDAFHACAGDYLGLMCLRNPSRATTRLAILPVDAIPERTKTILLEPRFIVGANVAQRVAEVAHSSPLLWGNPHSPYFRVNLNSTRALPNDPEAEEALGMLIRILRTHSSDFVFNGGEYWYIDNYRVAHGRGSFAPAFDGHDRWLKRLYITSSIRRSAHLREGPAARVLHPELDFQ